MEITGTQIILAPRQRVWDALNDPEILKRSLPGCESVERTSPEEFKVIMAAAIGPLRARFNGVLRMSDIRAPESCTMVFEGQGGAVGFGKGNSTVKLTESDGQTELVYTAEAQVGGKLAQVGSRLIDSVARKMANDFFTAFKKQLADKSEPVKVSASTGPVAPKIEHVAPLDAPNTSNKLPEPAVICKVPTESDSTGPSTPAPARTPLIAPTPSTMKPAGTESPYSAVVMVPGWWLGVSAVFGSVATLAGVLLAR